MALVETTKDKFFAHIVTKDIHPYPESPDYTVWRTRDGRMAGKSEPGWKHPEKPSRYWIEKGDA